MTKREEAIELLEANGLKEAASHVRAWRNKRGQAGGWDENLQKLFPAAGALLWPGGSTHVARASAAASKAGRARNAAHVLAVGQELRLTPGSSPAFDAYWMIDWSANSKPKGGNDSIWCAQAHWQEDALCITSTNFRTRDALAEQLHTLLGGEFRDARVLIGFDFPFGFPRGFAGALGHRGAAQDAWRTIWTHLERHTRDDQRNANNRFDVAAAINAQVTGGFGPFYGHPWKGEIRSNNLSKNQVGFFVYPRETLCGTQLAREREVDRRAKTSSTPWFLYGGGNTVGSQALVGIPRVARLRAQHGDARIWPFETGARLPSRSEARVVLAEIYPSLFYTRDKSKSGVHDLEQVVATARAVAAHDASGTVEELFAAPGSDEGVLHEEGWILGAT